MTDGIPWRILVVEDEMMIALMIEDMLEQLGYEVVGMAMRLDAGLRLARTSSIDVAILDVNLDGRLSFPVADVLAARQIPFFFATGYGRDGLSEAYRTALTLSKPFQIADLARTIRDACKPASAEAMRVPERSPPAEA